MIFEHHDQPLLPMRLWARRMMRSLGLAAFFIAGALATGIAGYHGIAHMPWIDSLLEASMILAGMGPISPLPTNAAKLFASTYALFSGLVFIGTTGILLAPIVHRILHAFHQDSRKK